MTGIDPDKAKQALLWLRKQYNVRSKDDPSHPPFLVASLLQAADSRFDLQSFGAKGHAYNTRRGLQYLNYGDSYDATIVVLTNATSARFYNAAGGWAPYAR